MFSDPRFLAAGFQFARRAVHGRAQQPDADRRARCLDGRRACGRGRPAALLHALKHRRRLLPTPERLLYEFRRFRARYRG